jgi:hypothetical protein
MSAGESLVSELRAALGEEARRRFGAARAEALAAELDALAGDLGRVAEASLPAETEPGFFLLEE